MKRTLLRAYLALCIAFVSIPSLFGQSVTTRSTLNTTLANSLYCQLLGCDITGASTINANFTLGSAAALQWGSSGVATPDLKFFRASAGVLQQSNGVTAQGFFQYNTTDSDSAPVNYERNYIGWSGNSYIINTQAGGTGTLRGIAIGINGLKWSLSGATPFQWAPAADNSYDLGDSTHRVKTGYYATGLTNDGTSPVAAPQNVYRVTSDFTLAANTNLQAITGLVITLAANTARNYAIDCNLLYSQATAAVADQFGIQAATYAPTNIMAKGDVNISASTFTAANLPTLTTTTATAIVTFTPTAITTVWNAHLFAMVENPTNASAQTLNIMAQTSNSADLVTVKRGSTCVVW